MTQILQARPLTALAFARYGTVVEAPAGTGVAINAGTTERFELVADLQLAAAGGRATLALFRSQARRFPQPLRELERHALGSQTFIPLGQHRFVLVVAPADGTPAAAVLEAFMTDGTQGAVLAPGTWHHSLLAVEGGDFAVIERVAMSVDCDRCELDRPVAVSLAD